MEIISLLPFFIFLLFVFLTIYRTKQRLKTLEKSKKTKAEPKKVLLKSQEAETEKKPGWKNILIDAYEQILREIKEAKEKREQKQAGYDIPERMKDKPKLSTILWEKEMLIPSPPPIPPKEIKKKKPTSVSPKPELVQAKEPEAIKADLPLIEKPTIRDLRKAVVWSEILAPPVALRENQDPF